MVLNLGMMTGPGMMVCGLGGAPLHLWLPPFTGDNMFLLSGACGLLWPLGIPVVFWALAPRRHGWRLSTYVLAVGTLLYLWAIVVSSVVHLTLA